MPPIIFTQKKNLITFRYIFEGLCVYFRMRSTVHQRAMGQAATVTTGYPPMEITDPTAQTHSLREGDINPKAPIYRKCVKRRERIETIRGTSIQVHITFCFLIILL